MDELIFTPAAVLDLLTQIDELSDTPISLTEQGSQIHINIGDSTYQLNTSTATEIKADVDTVEEVADVNDSAYEELEASGQVELSDPVESGIITGAIKALLLGGMIRLAPKLMK